MPRDLHDAVIAKDIEQLNSLLDSGANVNAKNECGRTPLDCYTPIDNNHLAIFERLFVSGAKTTDHDGRYDLGEHDRLVSAISYLELTTEERVHLLEQREVKSGEFSKIIDKYKSSQPWVSAYFDYLQYKDSKIVNTHYTINQMQDGQIKQCQLPAISPKFIALLEQLPQIEDIKAVIGKYLALYPQNHAWSDTPSPYAKVMAGLLLKKFDYKAIKDIVDCYTLRDVAKGDDRRAVRARLRLLALGLTKKEEYGFISEKCGGNPFAAFVQAYHHHEAIAVSVIKNSFTSFCDKTPGYLLLRWSRLSIGNNTRIFSKKTAEKYFESKRGTDHDLKLFANMLDASLSIFRLFHYFGQFGAPDAVFLKKRYQARIQHFVELIKKLDGDCVNVDNVSQHLSRAQELDVENPRYARMCDFLAEGLSEKKLVFLKKRMLELKQYLQTVSSTTPGLSKYERQGIERVSEALNITNTSRPTLETDVRQ